MAKPGDLENLVDTPVKKRYGGTASTGHPAAAASTGPADETRKSACGDCCSTQKSLTFIYVAIAVFLAAVTVALVLSIFFGPPQVTPHGFIASEESLCSKAGDDILRKKKGNAVDALVSTVLCLSVTRPDMISLGGCGSFIVHRRDVNKNNLFDAMCSSPTSGASASTAAGSVGVPGLVAGLSQLHKAHGYLSWSSLFDAALSAAGGGYKVNPEVMIAASKLIPSAPADHIVHQLKRDVVDGLHRPQPALQTTLRSLAQHGPDVFYKGAIGRSVVDSLAKQGVQWSAGDLSSYVVKTPAPLELGLAGFSIFSFPSPFAGGALATSALGNLDMLNHVVPLNARKLASNDPAETATVYHRLIELLKLGIGQVSKLGDPYDSAIGASVLAEQEIIMNATVRKQLIGKVDDNKVLSTSDYETPDNIFFRRNVGDSLVITVESDLLIASASLVMGAPFGSGLVTEKTGILLNAAQKFFSPSGSNAVAPRRRPLVPLSPVFIQTAQQKCGHRLAVSSFGGVSGIIDLSQVLTANFLRLSGVSCTGKNKQPHPASDVTTATYTPSVGACLPLNQSLALKRFSLNYTESAAGSGVWDYEVLVEPAFPVALKDELKRRGHKLKVMPSVRKDSGVALAGWTVYDTIWGVEPSAVKDVSWF